MVLSRETHINLVTFLFVGIVWILFGSVENLWRLWASGNKPGVW